MHKRNPKSNVHLNFRNHVENAFIPELETLAQEGSAAAAKYLKALKGYKSVIGLLKTNSQNKLMRDSKLQDKIITELADVYRIEYDIPGWRWTSEEESFLLSVLSVKERQTRKEISDVDLAVKICQLSINLKIQKPEKCFEFNEKCIAKYPNEVIFYVIQIEIAGRLRQFDLSSSIVEDALKKFPNDLNLLFKKATDMKHRTNSPTFEEQMQAYKDYLNQAEIHEHYVVEIYYWMALLMLSDKSISSNIQEAEESARLAKEYFSKGLEAEGHALPVYKNYVLTLSCGKVLSQKDFPAQSVKAQVALLLSSIERSNSSNAYEKVEDNTFILNLNEIAEASIRKRDRESQVQDPWRSKLILFHRLSIAKSQDIQHQEMNKEIDDTAKLLNMFQIKVEDVLSPDDSKPGDLIGTHLLKPILLWEMEDQMENKEKSPFWGRIIYLRSIEDVYISNSTLWLVVEDEVGNVHRCVVHDFKSYPEIQKNLGHGCKFSIVNPDISETENKTFLRVLSPTNLIFYPEERVDICRYCSAHNATFRCGSCDKAKYCNKSCQTFDWKLFKHKYVCSFLKKIQE